jgi:hypothetical protein
MVQKLNGTSARLNAERSEIPVMIPGSAMGSTTRSDTVSRPKNRVRATAAAQSVPSTSATSVEIAATRRLSDSAAQMSGRAQARPNHWSVSPGGGHT